MLVLLGEVHGSELSAEHREAIANDPELLIEGYATTATHPMGADYYWICPTCFEDFVGRYKWRVVDP